MKGPKEKLTHRRCSRSRTRAGEKAVRCQSGRQWRWDEHRQRSSPERARLRHDPWRNGRREAAKEWEAVAVPLPLPRQGREASGLITLWRCEEDERGIDAGFRSVGELKWEWECFSVKN